jgi:hypothetical protein
MFLYYIHLHMFIVYNAYNINAIIFYFLLSATNKMINSSLENSSQNACTEW